MDRSFLSSEDVVTASRNFVCIRTATYEDAGEAEFIKRTIFDGADDLRNFWFFASSPPMPKKRFELASEAQTSSTRTRTNWRAI